MVYLESDNEKLSFDDISLVPARRSYIDSRGQCCINIKDKKNPCFQKDILPLPVIASPMGATIDENNWKEFFNAGICPVIPRTVNYQTRLKLMTETFVAFSTEEAEKLFIKKYNKSILDDDYNLVGGPYYICIDVAQGHRDKLLNIISAIKHTYGPRVIVMSGNIANPEAYIDYYEAKCDYVRCSIGTGFCCTTSTLTATHYPPASLLNDIYAVKENLISSNILNKKSSIYEQLDEYPKIIADGGIASYADCIKAYACGADYVMVGRMFAQCVEACEEPYQKLSDGSLFIKDKEDVLKYINNHLESHHELPKDIYRTYYGMSTQYAQGKIAAAREFPNEPFEYKNAEGNVEEIAITNTLANWIDVFSTSVKSTMSYANISQISDLCNMRKIRISVNAFMAYKKHTSNTN